MSSLNTAVYPFIIGHFPQVHWSSYLAIRTSLSIPVSIVYLSATGGWASPMMTMMAPFLLNAATTATTSSSIPWISLSAGISIGILTNILRVASVYGCQELEAFRVGCAGIIGNIIYAEYIANTAIFAYLFFGEVMMKMELIGAIVIGGAVVGVTLVKAWRQRRDERRRSVKDAEVDGDAGKDREDEKDAKGIHLKEWNEDWKKEAIQGVSR